MRLGRSVTGRVFGEPLRDARHVLLEVAGGRDVEHPGALWATVLEVMDHVARHQDERPDLQRKLGNGWHQLHARTILTQPMRRTTWPFGSAIATWLLVTAIPA